MAITWLCGGDNTEHAAQDIPANGEITTVEDVDVYGKSAVLFYYYGESGTLKETRAFGLQVNADPAHDPTDESGAWGAGIHLDNEDGANGRETAKAGVVSISPVGPVFGAYSIRPVLRAGAVACESVSIGYEVFD